MRTALLIALIACLIVSTQAFAINSESGETRLKREKPLNVVNTGELLAMLAGKDGQDREEILKVVEELERRNNK